IDQSDPAQMAAFIAAAGFATQPNAFPSAAVEAEVAEVAPKQPWANVPSGWSATWTDVYQNAITGPPIAAPFPAVKVTDPDKLASMAKLYQSTVLSGSPLTEDIRDVFLTSGLADIGFAPQPDMDGAAILAQQCGQCHNSRLDPALSRENFLVDQ